MDIILKTPTNINQVPNSMKEPMRAFSEDLNQDTIFDVKEGNYTIEEW